MTAPHALASPTAATTPRALDRVAPGRGGTIALALFATPFAAVGVGMGWSAVQGLLSEGATRDVALHAIFALSFGGVGLGLWALLPHLRRKQVDEHARRQQSPDRPWLWREDWAGGRIPCGGRGAAIFGWVFALLWNLISAPLIWQVPKEFASGNEAALIGALFPVVGLGLLVWAARSALRWRKFGRSHLVLSTLPGVVGGHLAGTVELGHRVRAEKGFRSTLSCVRIRYTGSGKSRSRHEDVLWQEDRDTPTGELREGPRGTAVPVAFTIPYRLDPTSPEQDESWIEWRLDLSADLPGIDYAARFEVPVFRTADSSADVTDTDVMSDRGAGPTAVATAAGTHFRADSRIRVADAPDGAREIVFPPARNWRGALVLTAFTAVWTAIVAVLTTLDGPGRWMAVVFGAFDLLLLWGLGRMWLRTTRVVASPRGLDVHVRTFPFASRHTIAPGELETVVPRIRSQQGNRPTYDIQVHARGIRPVTAGDQIADKREAEWLALGMWRAVKGEAERPRRS